MGVRDAFVTVNGLRLHYLDWGTSGKRPMVFLHGLRGHAHSWDDISAAFCADYHVLALDQRGRGESDWASDGQYTTETYVADLVALVEVLSPPPFVLIGHSMGGRNAMMFASENPGHVAALVIVDVGPEVDPRGVARMITEIQRTPEEADSFEALVALSRVENPRMSEAVLRRRLQYQTKVLPSGKIGWRYDKVIRDQWRHGTRPPSPDFWRAVGNVRCPTLILRGAETDILPITVAKRMLDAIPNSRLVELPRAGHMLFEDNPADTIAAIRAFLADGADEG